MVEGVNVGKLEEGSKDHPSKYKLPMWLWGAVGLPKKKVKINTRLSPYIQDRICILRGA